MRALLDTHILLWCLSDSKALSKKARNMVKEADEVFASVVSLWEIAIKTSLGKLEIGAEAADLHQIILQDGYSILSINPEHIEPLANLPDLHRDPFDRLLISQSIAEPLRLITHDQQLSGYGSTIIIV